MIETHERRTLVISTDPAHSLGDALDQDISSGEAARVMGLDNLSAMEVCSSLLSSEHLEEQSLPGLWCARIPSPFDVNFRDALPSVRQSCVSYRDGW